MRPQSTAFISAPWSALSLRASSAVGAWRAALAATACLVGVMTLPEVAGAQSAAIVHIAGPANMLNDFGTKVDDPLLNGHPEALPVLVPIWNPDRGETGIYLEDELSIQYWGPIGRWIIFSHDVPIPAGAAFNVWIGRPTGTTAIGALFLHTASNANSLGHATFLDHPALNASPSAVLFVTKTSTTNGALNLHPIGVAYDPVSQRWAIYNEDEAPIAGLTIFPRYHVAVSGGAMGSNGSGFTVADRWCTAAATVGNSCFIDVFDPTLNGLYQRVHPGFYHPKALGLWWSISSAEWAVFTQDGSLMPDNLRFHLILTRRIFECGFDSNDTRGWSLSP